MPNKKNQNQKTNLDDIRHSLAHVLAAAVLELYPDAKLGVGPTIENGFYYDFDLNKSLTPQDLKKIEKRMKEIIKRGDDFKGKKLTIKAATKFFKEKKQPYKLELINDLAKYGTTVFEEIQRIKSGELKAKPVKQVTLYATGNFVDLCRGGHVKSSKELNSEALHVTKVSGAYWRGNPKNPQMQRIYAAAFETKSELEKYLKQLEEAEKRDHRKLGQQLDLFSFHDISPGSRFWHPKGMIIVKGLEKLIREELDEEEYDEISTPILVKKELWEKSGHWQHYKDMMFLVEVEKEIYGLKPMNCPESTLYYSSKIRSYKDLPLRLGEIGHLHRNELSGVMGGLFRVRQITMDDAHIFCRPDQIESEVTKLIKLTSRVYKIFGFKPKFYLSTRPEKAMGAPKLWEKAEKSLDFALKKNKIKFEVKKGEGAFYGPKVDVNIEDALGRDWQLATIQLDFQMPERFELSYMDEKGKKQQPVMIHRAIFGSFERFIGVLLEHFSGALPLWLAPIQISVIPLGAAHKKAALKFAQDLKEKNIRTMIQDENETISKKIRGAEIKKIPYMAVIGDKELKTKSVRLRTHKKGDEGMVKIAALIKKLEKEITSKALPK
jgi:threonyl-tRNA synthetase